MSVTFTAELGAVAGYVVCCCEAAAELAPRYGDCADALTALRDQGLRELTDDAPRAPLPGCEMPDVCPDYELHVTAVYADPAPEIRVHNRNAQMILEALGYFSSDDDETAGNARPDEFEGRVLVALAVAPADDGMPAYERTQPGGPRWFEGDRRPGYLQSKLQELQALAQWCRERDRSVQWA